MRRAVTAIPARAIEVIGARAAAAANATSTHAAAAAAAVIVVLALGTLSSTLVGAKVFSAGNNILQWSPFAAQAPPSWRLDSNSILTDPVLNFDPHRIDSRRDLSSGILPLWNPYAAAGRPLFGSQQDAPLYPLTWLAFVLPYWFSLAWIAVGKLLLAAGGTYLFCRELALRRGPSVLAAVAFAFGTYFFDWLEHPHTNVWAMLPWMFLAARRVCTRGSLGATALLGFAEGLSWLGEHPESGSFLFFATALYGVFELIGQRKLGARTIASRTALLAGGLGLGLGVGAVGNLPLLELTHQTAPVQRGSVGFELRAGLSYFFPEMWGMPSKAFTTSGPGINFNERTIYIGAVPLLLACAGIGRRRPREQWFFVVSAIVLIATIYDTPWAKLVRDLPGGNVTALNRLLVIVSFCGAVLAAFGLQRLLDATPAERRRMLWVMGAVAVLPVLAWLSQHTGLLSHLPAAVRQLPAVHHNQRSFAVIQLASVWRWVFICAIGLAVLALVRNRPVLIAIVIVLVGADLVALDRGYHPRIPLSEANPPVPAAIRYLQAHQGDQRIVASETTMPANIGERYQLRDARAGGDVLFPRRYLDLWTALGGVGMGEKFFLAYTPAAHRLADLFAIRYVLIPPVEKFPRWLSPVLKTSGGTVGVNSTALPRAWIAYDWRSAGTRTSALAMTVASPSAQAETDPVIEGAPPAPHAAGTPTAAVATVTRDGPEGITIQATATRPGYLILDDSAYPGWNASVDGHEVAWHPANESFRAVAIPTGRHLVNFRYRPSSVITGAVIAVLSLIAIGALALASRLMRPTR